MISTLTAIIILAGQTQPKLLNCIDSISKSKVTREIDFKKCIGLNFDEIELVPDSGRSQKPNYRDFKFIAYNSNEVVYTEQVKNSKLSFSILGDSTKFRVKDYSFGTWGNKSGKVTNITFLKKMKKESEINMKTIHNK